MAAQREIESTRKQVVEREEEILKLMQAIDSSKKSIEAHERDVAELRAHVAGEEEKTAARIAELHAATADERGVRDELASHVRADVIKRYSSIRMRRGLAVVPVTTGVCQGCHMAIPPQLYNILIRGETMETCPTCHRIIYWDEILKEKALEAGEQSEPQGDGAELKSPEA